MIEQITDGWRYWLRPDRDGGERDCWIAGYHSAIEGRRNPSITFHGPCPDETRANRAYRDGFQAGTDDLAHEDAGNLASKPSDIERYRMGMSV